MKFIRKENCIITKGNKHYFGFMESKPKICSQGDSVSEVIKKIKKINFIDEKR